MAEQEKKMSVAQMREILKAQGVRNTSVMRKAELQKLMAEMGLLEDQSEVLEKDKEQPTASVEKGPEHEVKSENKKPYVFRGRTSRAEYAERTGRAERTERPERTGRTERTERSERTERTERTERPERSERTERTERSERQTYTNGGLYSGRRNTYGQRSENYQRNENSQRNENGQRGENYQRNDSYQRGDSYQRVDVYQKNEYIQSNEESEIPGYGQLDSGMMANGILEVIPEGFGFIRCENYMPGNNDVYVSPAQIRRFNLRTGDIICGNIKVKTEKEKFSALLYIRTVNGMPPYEAQRRGKFENMTPVFPDSRINLETPNAPVSMRIMNLVSPIGRGQRGMIVSPPKTGKTTLLKQVAKAIHTNYPDMQMIILLIDERPEEVTDIKEYIEGNNVEVIYSTFDETPEHHKRVSEMVLERAKRLVEHKKDVVILLDSITRLARAYNLTVPPSGRTLSGGLDPAALHMPKKFFGAARNMREGGSLTVLATALVETGSKMDDVVFEEFKGTGNMELVLDRKLSEKRIFPAINIPRSGTRREELLLSKEELEGMYVMRKALGGMKSEEALEQILDMFMHTKDNTEFVNMIRHTKMW
ncbi:transcription termination factor Rho [Coprococcus catus GD/7]|uniref:Transcription termination factor Rho n=1 Tax=Coprococcus catus GD/7 TaxID=717962 RepID=D4J438_9FIRM|nr:transcription termination factor Rho [Coprococcus catus]CBK79109.1 transcription termination factor Rho [Coprococcus catus GD/7]